MPGLHLQRNRRKTAIQKFYDGRGNFNDGCVASGADFYDGCVAQL